MSEPEWNWDEPWNQDEFFYTILPWWPRTRRGYYKFYVKFRLKMIYWAINSWLRIHKFRFRVWLARRRH